MSLTPKNWDSFQHYKDRSPAWIKLHRGLLDDFDFARLPVASRALAPLLWLLASEYDGGKITASIEEIAFRFRTSHDDLIIALTPLIESKFFDASDMLAECKQDACLEKEDIEKRNIEKRKSKKRAREPSSDFEFEDFWKLWPNKVGKTAALKAFVSARNRTTIDVIVDGIFAYIRDKPPDRQWLNPATFLNQNRWEDQPAKVQNGKPKSAIIQAADNLARKLASFDALPSESGELCGDEGKTSARLLSFGRS